MKNKRRIYGERLYPRPLPRANTCCGWADLGELMARHGRHSPDLFHVQNEVCKATNLSLVRQTRQAEEALEQAQAHLNTQHQARSAYEAQPSHGRPQQFYARIAPRTGRVPTGRTTMRSSQAATNRRSRPVPAQFLLCRGAVRAAHAGRLIRGGGWLRQTAGDCRPFAFRGVQLCVLRPDRRQLL